ncbi:hypothetical protein ACQP60_08625 [Isoptericola variabilis]|uniref:hypothetical protein n=1 Tax=Isoptericola variabilis TaxID=139208 RepID=UPI003D21EA68
MGTRGWTTRRRALARLAPFLSREDVEAAAHALATEVGLEVTGVEVVTVQQVHELDGDEDVVHEVPHDVEPVPDVAGRPTPLAPLTGDAHQIPEAHPEPDKVDADERDAEAEREAQRALAERRRAVLAETEAALAKGRQWDELVAGR